MSKEVEFNQDDEMLVTQIVGRFGQLAQKYSMDFNALSATMDLNAANGVNGNAPLDLGKLMSFDDASFMHDMSGIARHMDRATGIVGDCFLPRCVE